MENWREDRLRQQLQSYQLQLKDLPILDQYEDTVSEPALLILLEWACYGQNTAGIVMGREMVAKLPRAWLKEHLLRVVKQGFDYMDDWNYRRLLELTNELLPECIAPLLALTAGTTDPDLKDVIDDYK